PTGGRGIRRFRLTHRPADSFYTVSFKVEGVDLERLNIEDPLCSPLAVIVGDDDGFVSVAVTSPSFVSRRVSLPRICIDPSASWLTSYTWTRKRDASCGGGAGSSPRGGWTLAMTCCIPPAVRLWRYATRSASCRRVISG